MTRRAGTWTYGNDEATLFYLRKNDFPSEIKAMRNDDRKREMRRDNQESHRI
jgi:hypothetical protein